MVSSPCKNKLEKVAVAVAKMTQDTFWTWQNIVPICLGAILLIFIIAYHRIIYIVLKTLPATVKIGRRFGKLKRILRSSQRKDTSLGYLFDNVVKKDPLKICFYFEEQKWTFKGVQEASSKFANYFASQGFKKGDSIALIMENRPEYVCIWLGLSKIGVVTAFINHNLRLTSLQHCILASSAKAIIYGDSLSSAIQEMKEMEGSKIGDLPLFCFGSNSEDQLESPLNAVNLNKAMEAASSAPPKPSEKIGINDKFCYIYTSGTTGLPKAAVIKHSRALMTIYGISVMTAIQKNDIVYMTLPLYHTQGGLIGIGQALFHGASVVIVKKFSASRFWKDCIKYNVTVCQYIGELCKYILNQPPSDEDKKHKVRMMFGNGVRPEIWQPFLDRFNNPKLCELYGSTEGNSNMINISGKVGAVGFFPRIAQFALPAMLIKVDPSGEPIRTKDGMVIKCKPGEPGELVAKIVRNDPVRSFDGYTDEKSSEKKILRSVFAKDDYAFRSGDILLMDEEGFFFFKDRTGDTFRWKGENVSTTEVEGVLGKLCNNADVAVYGVQIPNNDGRAGMGCITDPENKVDLEKVAQGLNKSLPAYAKPIFIRLIQKINTTGTFKLQKVDLQKEGYDIQKVTDKIYVLQGGNYVELTPEIYDQINNGKIRV